ncbi:long-chain fatty acid--CoA ligase [Demequina sp. NBRC 110057]|uniref:AMP-dependent synthetase/ligase n=1 Tax=Demequina sp. NBRC 110057 TaxID=1570346 RepID=UPI0009FCE7FF|nr:AMP-dependent synthetase/ligase [Demequina sp. NBRC 110057]
MPPQDATYAPHIVSLVRTTWDSRATTTVARSPLPDDSWVDITGAQARAQVDATAKGLIAHGVKPGDRVAILARTRWEWTVCDLAIMTAGAIPVPIYDTSSVDQIQWICEDAEVSVVIAERESHAARAREVLAQASTPLREVLVIDEGAMDTLAADGAAVTDGELDAALATVGHETLATIMYTSGTTGRPKGVELTQFSYTRHIAGMTDEMSEIILEDGASTVLFLTLAHSLARLVQHILLAGGVVIGYCPDASRLVPLIGTMRPTLLLAVPRVFEKVYNGAEQKAAADGKVKIFRWAAQQSIAHSKALDTERGPGIGLKLKHAVADALVLKKIRALLGGRAHWAVSGSAPLGDRLGHFYRGLGLVVLEGYGLTETNAASHVNRTGLAKIGTVGPALPGIEVRIADDGEVLMRGEQLFTGYHRNPTAFDEAVVDGWFHTGDIGAEDADGYLTITGRKKEIIVTAGGKNVAPAELEDRIRGYALVSQCVVVGDAQPFIAALITLDADALPGWLKGKGWEPMTAAEAAQDPRILERIQKAVDRANRAVSRAESVRTFRIIDGDLTVENGYLTPSLKVKRARVLADFAPVIESIYSGKHGGN